ncbi:MAG: GntR family transcriptional regulator [Planctomycetes bacterium]|nr:GntR family transcriptional regulator [Planctomycetota bacterium]
MTGSVSKWRRVYNRLKRQALVLPPGTPIGRTIQQLAADFGVNHKTVCRAVALLQTENIIEAKPGIGLKVHPGRSAVKEQGQYILYVCRHTDDSGFESGVQEAVRAKAEESGFNMRPVEAEDVADIVPLVEARMVAGALVSFFHLKQSLRAAFRRLARLNVPVVTIDEEAEGCDGVLFDNRSIGRLVGRRLATQKSFKRIMILYRESYAQPEYERECGIREVFDEMKVPHERVMWVSGEMGPVSTVLTTYWEQGMEFDAVYFHGVSTAAVLREICETAGIPVPYMISSGIRLALDMYKVDGVRVPVSRIGEIAAGLLLERLSRPDAEPRVEVVEGKMYYPGGERAERKDTI